MTAQQTIRWTCIWVVAATIASCARDHRGTEHEDAGDGGSAPRDRASLDDETMRPSDPLQSMPTDAAPASPQIELIDGAAWPEGLWVGQTPVGNVCRTTSLRVSIRFESDADGRAPRGHVVFGDHEKIPPVDPAHGYPEKHVHQSAYRCRRDELYDGYPYPIRSATVWPDGRMTLWLSPDEMYDDWCVLQTSYPTDPDATAPDGTKAWDHTCFDLPFSKYRFRMGDPAACPIDYDKFQMCNGRYCRCTEDGCRAPFLLTTRLDLVITEKRMEGVILTGIYAGGGPIKLHWAE